MAGKDREADLTQCIAEVLRERRRAHVARADHEAIVELLVPLRLREVVALALLHLVVPDEVLVRGVDAVLLGFHLSSKL